MKDITRRWLEKRKRKIERRLARQGKRQAKRNRQNQTVMSAHSIKYEVSDKTRGLVYGGIGLMRRLAERTGLVEAIDDRLHLLPLLQSEGVICRITSRTTCSTSRSMHSAKGPVWKISNCGGTTNVFWMRWEPKRFPTRRRPAQLNLPVCRRFSEPTVRTLLDAIDAARRNVWQRQSESFFDEAVIDMDGTLVVTGGECKEGMDISYKGTWGYHPLIVSLANTGELLSLVNRSGNRPSEEGAATEADRAARLCRRAGFRRIVFRGDTAFSQSEQLDGWNEAGDILFYFGYPAMGNLVERANSLPETAWTKPARRSTQSKPCLARNRPTSNGKSFARGSFCIWSWSAKRWRSSRTLRRRARIRIA